jgi:transcriptional regulator NrdR
MRCPKCGSTEDKVVDSREARDGHAIRRRRECQKCQFRFTTYEIVEREELRVVKNNGVREPFSREKLLGGMRKACEKRPVTSEILEQSVDEIADELEQEGADSKALIRSPMSGMHRFTGNSKTWASSSVRLSHSAPAIPSKTRIPNFSPDQP